MERIMNQFDYCVFDLETTGFEPDEGAKIIEIGAVCLDQGEITDRYHQLVDPEEPLDDEIVELTGIRDQELLGKPSYDQVLPEFAKFVGDRYLVAHNADFDVGFLEAYAQEPIGRGVVDTLELARNVVNLNSNRLGNLARVFDVDLDNAHRADADAEATAEVFRRMWARMRWRSHYTGTNLPEEIQQEAPPPVWKRIFTGGDASLWESLKNWLISPRETQT